MVYISKVVLGLVIGTICGYLNLDPLVGWAVLIIGIVCLVVLFKFVLGFDIPLLYIALWYGTFSYFIAGITSWTIIYNLIHT